MQLATAKGGLRREGAVLLPIEGGIVVKRRRGFAVMEPSRQREIASKGGKAAHEKGTAHRWSEQEAKEAGRKGGAASHRNGHRTSPRVNTATEHFTTNELATDELGNDELTTDELGAKESTAKDPERNTSPS
jgi:general stress protein YciG